MQCARRAPFSIFGDHDRKLELSAAIRALSQIQKHCLRQNTCSQLMRLIASPPPNVTLPMR